MIGLLLMYKLRLTSSSMLVSLSWTVKCAACTIHSKRSKHEIPSTAEGISVVQMPPTSALSLSMWLPIMTACSVRRAILSSFVFSSRRRSLSCCSRLESSGASSQSAIDMALWPPPKLPGRPAPPLSSEDRAGRGAPKP